MTVKEKISLFPHLPGVYRYYDAAGNVIAVYTSDYADYASHAVPSGNVAIKGILQRGKIDGGEYFMIKMRDETDCTPLD